MQTLRNLASGNNMLQMQMRCPKCGSAKFARAPSIDGNVYIYCVSCDNPVPVEFAKPVIDRPAVGFEGENAIGDGEGQAVGTAHTSGDVSVMIRGRPA